jgi:hypothetical protein
VCFHVGLIYSFFRGLPFQPFQGDQHCRSVLAAICERNRRLKGDGEQAAAAAAAAPTAGLFLLLSHSLTKIKASFFQTSFSLVVVVVVVIVVLIVTVTVFIALPVFFSPSKGWEHGVYSGEAFRGFGGRGRG